jgi:thiamine biosynthesis protein ThiI
MKKVILIRCGEIILKGLNRPVFEARLIKNIKREVSELGKVTIIKSQSRMYIEAENENFDFETCAKKVCNIFGVVSVSIATKIDSDYEDIKKLSNEYVKNTLKKTDAKTFKVETKRGNKRFPMDSPEICRELGGFILETYPSLSVDVINPDFTVYVEVRESTYIYTDILKAMGGMPVGSNGKAVLLLSGGIDSPVAGFMISKRGVALEAVHFYSYPYTSERAKDKVIELAQIISRYCGKFRLHVIPFTDIQLQINEKCPQDYLTIIMRRVMMDIAQRIAVKTGSRALITGESVGQVASQTLESLHCTNAIVSMPVLRPLIGMDKNEVIEIARKIGTFETSILPYEDCCTVFIAKHPVTKPQITKIIEAEKTLDLEDMINMAITNSEIIIIDG